MPRPYPPHLTAHAEPSAAAYHVHCPQCQGLVGGAWAEAIGLNQYLVHCPRCQTTAPGRFTADYPLSVGAYSGRAISTLRSEQERDYLDYLLQGNAGEVATNSRVRLAILWQLGWLSAARAHVAAGPDLTRLQASAAHWLHAQEVPVPPEPTPQQVAREQAQARGQASWLHHLLAQQERRRGGGPRRPQQFYEYQRPVSPPVEPWPMYAPPKEEQPEWARTLELMLPVTKEQIKKAFRRLSRANHPDRGGDTAKMQQIALAREAAEKWLELVPN